MVGLELEDVLAAVLVVADEFFAFAGAGDGERVFVFVGDGAAAFVAFHGDVTPYTAVGSVAGDVEYFVFLGFFPLDGPRGGFGCGLYYFGFGLRLGFGLRVEGYGVVNGFGGGLGLFTTIDEKGHNCQQNER